LFVYGTLECDELMLALVGPHSPSVPAVLAGYRRGMMEGRRYPGIVPSTSHRVQGRIYAGLSDEALAFVDCYEADEYERLEVDAEYADGRLERVFVYVARIPFRELVIADAWDAEAFRTEHLSEYLELCTHLRQADLGKSGKSEKTDSADEV
jgi:gamma-glutamylcyclotransferase (GGCT)/AIG2-like uncharacterized protein YtfP